MAEVINIQDFKAILCLNGILPDREFFKKYPLPVIAADGSANDLVRMGVMPEVAIGDLDSIEPILWDKVKIIAHYDQNFNDFQKALKHLQQINLLPAIIVGVNGGFLDHILNNINIFLSTNSVLYAPPIWGFILKGVQSKSYQLPLKTKISLIGIPAAEVSTQGLEWNVDYELFAFPGKNSCFNCTQQETIQIEVHAGALLVLIYLD